MKKIQVSIPYPIVELLQVVSRAAISHQYTHRYYALSDVVVQDWAAAKIIKLHPPVKAPVKFRLSRSEAMGLYDFLIRLGIEADKMDVVICRDDVLDQIGRQMPTMPLI